MNTPHYQQALGRNIAAERRRRGRSQPELDQTINRSVAWILPGRARRAQGGSHVGAGNPRHRTRCPAGRAGRRGTRRRRGDRGTTGRPRLAPGAVRYPCPARHAQRPPPARTRNAPQPSPPGMGPDPRRAVHRPDGFAARPDPGPWKPPPGQPASPSGPRCANYWPPPTRPARPRWPSSASPKPPGSPPTAPWPQPNGQTTPCSSAAGAFRLVFVFLAARHHYKL